MYENVNFFEFGMWWNDERDGRNLDNRERRPTIIKYLRQIEDAKSLKNSQNNECNRILSKKNLFENV